MKKLGLLAIIASLILILAACQPEATQVPATSPANQVPSIEYPAPQVPASGYPAPQQPVIEYPAPANAGQVESPAVAYPALVDGDLVEWNKIEAMALNGEISKIVHGDSVDVSIILKDGRTLSSIMPQAGFVESLIEFCGEACGDIEVVIE